MLSDTQSPLFYDLHDVRLTHEEVLLELKHFIGSLPLLTPNPSCEMSRVVYLYHNFYEMWWKNYLCRVGTIYFEKPFCGQCLKLPSLHNINRLEPSDQIAY